MSICRHENAGSSPVGMSSASPSRRRGSSSREGHHTVFDGPMPAGTLHVTGPGQPLTAEFRGPCDFVHFHVSSDYLRECQEAARSSQAQPIRDLNDLIVRDRLPNCLARRWSKAAPRATASTWRALLKPWSCTSRDSSRRDIPSTRCPSGGSGASRNMLVRISKIASNSPILPRRLDFRPCILRRNSGQSNRIPSARLSAPTADRKCEGHAF